MQVDIKTADVKPVRKTFTHLERRFGDKVATRYQEATCDIQSTTNFHYKPLWDPDRDMYDRRRTAITFDDWFKLKDPRQFYYGTYTIARARWQDGVDRQVEFVAKRQLLEILPESVKSAITGALIPLRHYEWGANTNNAHISAYGWDVAITQAAMMHTMDRLGLAQHLSRIGLMLDGTTGDSLDVGKQLWLEAPEWQGLRREIENMFVTRDWFELLIAQNLVADGVLYPLFYGQVDAKLSETAGTAVLLLTEPMTRWFDETTRWVDAVVKAAASENEANRDHLVRWTEKWRAAMIDALTPLAAHTLGGEGAGALAAVVEALDARCARLGVGV